jgi:hypothetical protein
VQEHLLTFSELITQYSENGHMGCSIVLTALLSRLLAMHRTWPQIEPKMCTW